MKKLISVLLTIIMAVSATAIPAIANDNITVKLDGKEVAFDVAPQLVNERTMVPVRAIFEALGATVEWDQQTNTVTSSKDGTVIQLTINNPIMKVNGREVVLDTAACIIGERTLVPVRAISESFNLNVDWDGTAKTVIINSTAPTPSYDNVLGNVDMIKSYIANGLYLEAIDLCDTTLKNYNLSPADNALITGLRDTAKTDYDNYTASIKPTYSAFDTLKQSVINGGTYSNKYGTYDVSYFHENSMVSLSYDASKDEIISSLLTETPDGTSSFTMLTLSRNENPHGGITFGMGSLEYSLLFNYENGRKVTVYNEFPSSMRETINDLLNSSIKILDLYISICSDVSLADFGVYYSSKAL